jgi:hypothetical protein
MKVSSLLDVLRNFESAAAALTESSAACDLGELRPLFAGHEHDSAATFLNALIKQRDLHGRRPNVPALRYIQDTLKKLEALLRSAEGKKGADDVAKLAELLDGCGQASVSEFVREAHGWLDGVSKPKARSAKAPHKKSTAIHVPTLRPDEYARLLKDTSKDNAQFDQLVERLRADKKIKKTEMREVALLFLGYELAKKKGREDALAAIAERQKVEARQEARGSVLDRLKPW